MLNKRALAAAAVAVASVAELELHNGTFGSSRYRVARMHLFIARQRRKERTRASAKRHRRHPCGGPRR